MAFNTIQINEAELQLINDISDGRKKTIDTLQAEIDTCKKRVNNYRLSCNELESEANKAVDMLEIVLYEYEEDMKIRHQEQIAGLIEKRRGK